MEAVTRNEAKHNRFMFVIDRIYDLSLLALLCVITSHNSNVEGKNFKYYAVFFILLAVGFLRAIFRAYITPSHFRIPIQTFWYGIFVIVCISSTLWAQYPESVNNIISKLTQNLILSYLMIINIETKEDFRRTQDIFILSIIYMGFRFLFSVTPSQLFAGFLGNRYVTGHNVNSTAYYYALVILIVFFRFYAEKKKLYIIPVAFLSFMLLLTSSRKAVAMVILGVFLTIIFDRSRKHKIAKILFAVFVVLIVLYLAFTNEKLYRAIGWKFNSMINFIENETGDRSLYERSYFRKFALSLFYQHPILGVGIGNFSDYIGRVFSRSTYSHNNWLEMLSCLGILGFSAYYWFYVYLIVKLRNQLKKGVLFTTPFLVIVLSTLFSEYAMVVYYDTFIQLVIALCFIGVSVADSELRNNRMKDLGGKRIGKE